MSRIPHVKGVCKFHIFVTTWNLYRGMQYVIPTMKSCTILLYNEALNDSFNLSTPFLLPKKNSKPTLDFLSLCRQPAKVVNYSFLLKLHVFYNMEVTGGVKF